MCEFPGCRFKGASRKHYLLKHMQSSHGGAKDPISQNAIRLYYQGAPNAIVSQIEERYLDLLEAISQGDEMRVKELLSMNASLLARQSMGAAAGDLAIAKGHFDILKMIAEAGVDVNINTTDPWLHQALRNGHSPTIMFLIKSGAKLLTRGSKGIDGSDLEVVQLNVLKKMVEAGIDVNVNDNDPWLHQALRNGHSTTAEFLVKFGAKLLTRDSSWLAAKDLEATQLNILKKMVKAGADVNSNKTDPWLHQALRNGHIATAEFLIRSGADVDAKSSENQTAFEAAVFRGSDQAIRLLHQSGADIYPGSGSQSRLREAILHLNDPYLWLWGEYGVKVGERSDLDTHTRTSSPFEFHLNDRAGPGELAVAKLLLDYGAEIRINSSLEISSSLSEVEDLPAVDLLFQYGSNIHKMPLSDKEPATTLLSAINYENEYNNDYIIQLRLEKRTNPNGRHLWERILFRGEHKGKECVFRLLCEWKPKSIA
jgi:ankyrin repeat protein